MAANLQRKRRTTICHALVSALTLSLAVPFAPAAHGEQTGNPRRILVGDYDKSVLRMAIVDRNGTITWQYPVKGEVHDVWLLANGNILFQTDLKNIWEVTPAGKVVWHYDAATQNGNIGRPVEVHAFQRLDDGLTMLAESGPARILEVNHNGRIRHEMKLTLDRPNSGRDTRLVRKLPTGNYLVAHEGDACVREYELSGKVVWNYNVGSKVYSAIRLAGGNTLIGTGDGHRVIEVDPRGVTVWSVERNDLPGITLGWITMVARLADGNTVLVNCHAGQNNPQIIEVTPQKTVVWTFQDFRQFGNALPIVQLLDEPQPVAR